jgi:hypothetical protein
MAKTPKTRFKVAYAFKNGVDGVVGVDLQNE